MKNWYQDRAFYVMPGTGKRRVLIETHFKGGIMQNVHELPREVLREADAVLFQSEADARAEVHKRTNKLLNEQISKTNRKTAGKEPTN